MLTLELLGPVRLDRDGSAVPLTVRKTSALLVLLALGGAAGRPRIVEMLWPGQDESSGRRNLRRELARLRELGVADAVQADGDRLSLGAAVLLDLCEGEALLARRRGPLAEDLDLADAPAFMAWLEGERARWQQRWHAALEAAALAAEARGDAGAALALLDRLLADDPLQEHLHRRAMQWLAAAGRREEALARYRHCCELLQSELGLEPMPQTRALAEALRGGAGSPAASAPAVSPAADSAVAAPAWPASPPEPPTTPAPAHAPAPAPAPPPAHAIAPARLPAELPFVGRSAEVAWLERAWRTGGTVLVEGEGGVGKSRLVRDVVSLLGPTAWVRCHAADAELPLSSIARALRVLAGDPPDLAALPAWAAAELPRLLPELGPPPLPLRSEPERQRFAQAVMLAWTAWGRENFDAVVLDDWHLADDASAALLPQLTAHHAGDGAAPLREILVYRPDLAPASAKRLQRLRDGGAAHCFLAPLSPEAVLELLQCLSGAARPERFARRIAAATGGHPFHLSETLRHLIERGELLADAAGVWHTRFDEVTEDYRELPLPPSVRDAVIVRVQRLDPAARRVLDAAALAAEPFDAALLAPACGLSEVDTLIALEAAHQARLLAGRGAGWGFVHDLVPQSLAAAMDEQRRRSVHRRLALGAAAANAAPALVARHFEAGGEPARAAPYRLAAGDAAERLHMLSEAVVQWRAALAALAEGPAPALESASRLRLVRTLRYLGDLAGSAAEVAALVALAPRLDPGPRHEAIAGAAGALWHLHRAAEVLPLLDGLPPSPDPGSAARVAQRRAEALRELGRLDEARAIAETLRASDALADSDRADLLDGMVLIEERAGRPARALELLAEATALSERIGDDFGVARGRYRRGTLLFHAGELAAAEVELRAGLVASRRLGTTFNSLALLQRLTDVALARQRWSEVLALVDEAWHPPEGPPGGLLAFVFRAARVSALEALGEPAGAEEEARRAAELLLQVPAHLQIEAALLLPLAPLARAAPRQLGTLAQALAAPAAAAGEPGLEWLRRLAAARC